MATSLSFIDSLVPCRAHVDAFAGQLGMPANVVRLVVGLVLGCVLAPLSHLVKAPNSRHLLNTVLGMAIGWFVFDVNLIHSLVPTLLTYSLMLVAPRQSVGQITSIILFTHLVASHAYREFFSGNIIWDGAQMVLTLKLSGTAISFGDGRLPNDKKSSSILRNQLVDVPSLLSLFGYVYFFPTFLVGPIFEFNEYMTWVSEARVAPLRVHLYTFGMLLVCITGHTISEVYFPILEMDKPTYYPDQPFAVRFFLQLVSAAFFKFRFYMVWQFGEVGGVLAGYGYNAKTQTWDGLQNNNVFLVELPVNLRVAINGWNSKVAKWLNTYVYQRVGHKNGKPTIVSTLSVFVASAAWHGLLPGYYAFFVMGGLGVEVGRHSRRRFRSYFHYTQDRSGHPWAPFFDFLDSKKGSPLAIFYDLGGLALSWFMMSYTSPSFVWLDMARCYRWWSTVYCIPHVMTFLTLAIFIATDSRIPQAKKMNVPGRDVIDEYASSVGLPVNMMRLVVGLIAGCVLAPLAHVCPTPTTRHVFNTAMGIAIAWFVFDVSVIHSIIPTLVTYCFIQWLPRATVGRVTAIFLFAYLLAAYTSYHHAVFDIPSSHVYREIYGGDIMWDAPQMVLTLKLTGTAISYGDGGAADKKSTSSSIRRNQFTKKPSLLEIFGYVFFFPTFLVGPIFEFNEYMAWNDANQLPPLGVVLEKVFRLVICLVAFFAGEVYVPLTKMDSPDFYPDESTGTRIFLQLLAGDLYKFRFILVWQLGELGGVLAGYGFDPVAKNWHGLRNNDLFMTELPVNFRTAVNNWNMKVQKWLTTYVYERVGWKNGKPTTLSTLSVFVASAIWHGLHPGYYVFFVAAAMAIEVGRHIRRRFRPYFHYTDNREAHPLACFAECLNPKIASPLAIFYDIGGLVACWIFFYSFKPSFVWLNLSRCIQWWSTLYFIPQIALIATFVGLSLTAPKHASTAKKAQ